MLLKECDCSKAVSEQKIFSEDELETIKTEVRSRMKQKKYNGYFINGYAILLSIETGMRAGELPALKWCDIHENYIHIHAQQLSNKRKGGKEYYYADWTKDEKGVSRGGRKFPLTKNIKNILSELKSIQEGKGIHYEFVFCNTDGEWIKQYSTVQTDDGEILTAKQVKDLQKRNAQLEEELLILKKAYYYS